MSGMRRLALAPLLLFPVMTGACDYCVESGVCNQNPEKMARYVTAPLDSLNHNYDALEDKVHESQIRLTTVRDSVLRIELAGVISRQYQVLAYEKRALEEQRAEAARRSAFIAAIRNLEIGWRVANLDDSWVLQLRNSADIPVQFDLKCYSGATYKTLFVSVPARGASEVGWIEGWAFQPGQHCIASYQGETLWERRI